MVPDHVWRRLTDAPVPDDEHLPLSWLRDGNETLRAAWARHGDAIVTRWADESPGRRPSYWWKYTAPEMRQRLGGHGTPCHECLAHVPSFRHGIPDQWLKDWMVAYYTGRARDVHGAAIGVEFAGRPFAGEAIDPRDPPQFESQAAFLRRVGALLPGELGRLTTSDFRPETLPRELWPHA